MKKNNENKTPPFPAQRSGGFIVPEGYFDRLPERILARIHSGEQRPSFAVPRNRTLLMLAAAITFLTLVITGLWYQQTKSTRSIGEVQEAVSYYQENIDLAEEDLYRFIESENIDISTTFSNIDNETIISYLLEQGIDYVTIEETL